MSCAGASKPLVPSIPIPYYATVLCLCIRFWFIFFIIHRTMTYSHLHTTLRSALRQDEESISIPDSPIVLRRLLFQSACTSVLPGADGYRCERHHLEFPEEDLRGLTPSCYPESLHVWDAVVRENHRFSTLLFCPSLRAQSLIFLFHGLNERSWDKYLTWGYTLAERTGASVMLFPIAFHMNRATPDWAEARRMSRVVEERRRLFPNLSNASFANAAISARIHHLPQRFCWSGLQTYHDVVQVLKDIRMDRYPTIAPDARVDFFAYSIGAFLGEILMMANPSGLLSDTRLAMFCGGPTLDRMYPSSRSILDSEAVLALHAFFIEHLEKEFERHPRLAHYFTEHRSGQAFRAMLSFAKGREYREKRIRELSPRLSAITLRHDDVVLPGEVMNTLQGEYRDIPVPVEVLDFDHPATHITPFPLDTRLSDAVHASFDQVFQRIASFLS